MAFNICIHKCIRDLHYVYNYLVCIIIATRDETVNVCRFL